MDKKVKIFLDDVRQPNQCLSYMHTRIGSLNPIYGEEWIVVRNYGEFTRAIEEHFPNISHISFDHDLADIHYDPNTQIESFEYQEETGYDCAKWMIKYYEDNNEPFPVLFVHSCNPVGTKNIINLFK